MLLDSAPDPHDIVGRDSRIAQVMRDLENASVVQGGVYRTGKTSLLCRLLWLAAQAPAPDSTRRIPFSVCQ